MIKHLTSGAVLFAALAACSGEPGDASSPQAAAAGAPQAAAPGEQAAGKMTLTYFNVDG